MGKKIYVLKNNTHQNQQLPLRGRQTIPPGGTYDLPENLYPDTGIQRVLAQGRFTVVNTRELESAPLVKAELDPAPDGGEAEDKSDPKGKGKSKGRKPKASRLSEE